MTSHDTSNVLARVDALAARARMERPPEPDVVRNVMGRLRQAEPSDRPMVWIAAFAATAAAVVFVVSLPYFTSALDPLSTFYETTVASPL